MQSISKQARVNNLYPYKFRHTFAINFLRNGGNLFDLQTALGHSNLETVKLYAKLAETDLEAASKHASVADRWNL